MNPAQHRSRRSPAAGAADEPDAAMTAAGGAWRGAPSAGQAWFTAALGRIDSRAGDAIIAAACVATLVALLAAEGELTGWHHLVVAAVVAAACCCPLARRGHPQLAAMAAAALGGIVALTGSGTDAGAFGVLFIPAFLVGYSLGADRRLVRSVAALAVLGVSLEFAAGQWNPFIIVILIGPFVLGVVSRSRRTLADQLAVRGRELAAEEELFAAEAARYERLRIARELHDIVAHSVSVMVIQAAAGQRLTGRDPALAAEAFDTIGAVARQAEAEIGQLVDLLDTGQPAGDDGLRLIAELVTRAAATGLDVGCRFDVAAERLSARAAHTAYRVVQESLTNALRHAPGAPVQITLTGSAGHIQLSVASGPSTVRRSGLETSGTGRGLAGMRERVQECGGEFAAGPTAAGWTVTAAFPADC
jgi:signal transduction histidine kinase